MLGDAWLGPAIRAGLLQPIPDALASRWWVRLPSCAPGAVNPALRPPWRHASLKTCREWASLLPLQGTLSYYLLAAQTCLSPRWQRLVRRDGRGQLSERGDVWAAPHRWGCTLVATRTDKLLRCAPRSPSLSG